MIVDMNNIDNINHIHTCLKASNGSTNFKILIDIVHFLAIKFFMYDIKLSVMRFHRLEYLNEIVHCNYDHYIISCLINILLQCKDSMASSLFISIKLFKIALQLTCRDSNLLNFTF